MREWWKYRRYLALLLGLLGLVVSFWGAEGSAQNPQVKSLPVVASAPLARTPTVVSHEEIERAIKIVLGDNRFGGYEDLIVGSKVSAVPLTIEGERRGVSIAVVFAKELELKGPWVRVDIEALLKRSRPDVDVRSVEGVPHDEIESLFAQGRPVSIKDYSYISQNDPRLVPGIQILVDVVGEDVVQFTPLVLPPMAPPAEPGTSSGPVPTLFVED